MIKLKLELGRDPASGQGQQELTKFKYALKHAQEELYENHDWEFLDIHRDESLVAGSRYYSFDPDLSFERIRCAVVKENGDWYPVSYGISPHDYNIEDSDSDEREGRVLKWDAYESDQFEVWPIPDANDQTLRFYGTKNLAALSADTDRADLDDLLIVYTAAMNLSRDESEMAKFARKAQERLTRLKGQENKIRVFNMGGHQVAYPSGHIRIRHVH